ncbi:guanine nucleotide binding protein, alpha subunit [Ephemerocybe angulata]|uniref:Guanine nucleotide binding protein, alpha subunit n=1 Tax=Ephemerocybe angulata TaxID=980116 RepID=A0A8H6HQI1_9AGAR|nr:guanine nucleotide binding protein, alpha subunit [Tulosesus angulatus]
MMAQTQADDYDPLEVFTRAPANETPAERRIRQDMETKAKERSDDIDRRLEKERRKLRRGGQRVRILLLGQSGSGKSALLRGIQMTYDPKWQSKLINWRPIIHLNLLNNVVTILDAIQVEENARAPSVPLINKSTLGRGTSRPRSTITHSHQLLARRLTPLRAVEANLRHRLGLRNEDETYETSVVDGGCGKPKGQITEGTEGMEEGGTMGGKWTIESRAGTVEDAAAALEASLRSNGKDCARVDEATEALTKYRGDIISLWEDEGIRALVKDKKITLDTDSGLFLDDVRRIAQHNYTPSNSDALRAQIRTRGIEEYHIRSKALDKYTGRSLMDVLRRSFPRVILPYSVPPLRSSYTIRMPFASREQFSIRLNFQLPFEKVTDWVFYEVGGGLTDSQKGWVSFFENMDAVVILTPLSTFDERLAEGPRINKLEDSFFIWKTVCSSRFLSETALILVMNKCHLLKKKLEGGTRVVDYLPAYGTERSNDVETVTKYFHDEFKKIRQRSWGDNRATTYYHYANNITDTTTAVAIFNAVGDAVMSSHLKASGLI